LLHRMAEEGRTILFSSHILEEVEQLSGTVQVIVSGRLAASGDYRHIRRLMTNRPHVFTIQSSDDRKLATVLMGQESVTGVRVEDGTLQVHANDYGTFTRALAKQAKASDVRLTSVLPADESLEKVFSYLVAT
jgi:ABC-2 type transport system ATP-binding protein